MRKLKLIVAVLFLMPSLTVFAVPIEVGIDAFGPGATTIDFDTYPAPGAVPLLPGITITPNGFVQFNDGTPWGGTSDPGRNNLAFASGLELLFDFPVIRVGFVFGGNTTNSVPVDLGFGGPTTGSFAVTSISGAADGINNWIFYGYEDLAGIDRITFGPESNFDWIVGIYDIIYETAAVPEPGTLALLGIGLFGMGLARRRKKV